MFYKSATRVFCPLIRGYIFAEWCYGIFMVLVAASFSHMSRLWSKFLVVPIWFRNRCFRCYFTSHTPKFVSLVFMVVISRIVISILVAFLNNAAKKCLPNALCYADWVIWVREQICYFTKFWLNHIQISTRPCRSVCLILSLGNC